MDRFWIVLGKMETVNRRFSCREAAEVEAMNMAASNAGTSFSVMECVSAFRAPVGKVEALKVNPPWVDLYEYMATCPVPGESTIEIRTNSFGEIRTGKAAHLWAAQENEVGLRIRSYRVIEQSGE